MQDTDAAAPAGGTNGSGGGPSGFGWDTGPSGDDVVVPPAEQTQEYRLPIFEAVESDWFRRGRSSVGWSQEAESRGARHDRRLELTGRLGLAGRCRGRRSLIRGDYDGRAAQAGAKG